VVMPECSEQLFPVVLEAALEIEVLVPHSLDAVICDMMAVTDVPGVALGTAQGEVGLVPVPGGLRDARVMAVLGIQCAIVAHTLR
jgi:hypothetical protein